MDISLLKLKRIVKKLEEGAKGVALSKISIEFWLEKSSDEEVLLKLKRVGQFDMNPAAVFIFKCDLL